jgi:hypothetical protein
MGNAAMLAGSVLLAAATAAAAASSDYYLKIDGVARTGGGPFYLRAHSSGDLDGDGLPDELVIRLECTAGVMHRAEYQVTSPRDASTGQASGKRMHKPFTIVKEWGAASPQLLAMKTGYDVKKVEGTGARGKTSMDDSWSPISLSNAEELCAAAAPIVKSKSNITNN